MLFVKQSNKIWRAEYTVLRYSLGGAPFVSQLFYSWCTNSGIRHRNSARFYDSSLVFSSDRGCAYCWTWLLLFAPIEI